MLVLSCFN